MYQKDLDLAKNWQKLLDQLEETVGKRPKDLNGVLYLIGIQELGKGPQNFSKEEKQDLIHIAICKVLSLEGFYSLEGLDKDGWPHWHMEKKMPKLSLADQEKFLKMQVMEYFQKEVGL